METLMAAKRLLSPNGFSQVFRDPSLRWLFAASLMATPDPVLPGWSHATSTLFHVRFEEADWPGQWHTASVTVDYGKFAERFSGFALQRTGKRLVPALAATGIPNTATDAVSTGIWFKPGWTNAAAGGVGPGDAAPVVEMVVVGWSSQKNGEASALLLVGAGGTSECFTNSPLYITNTATAFASNQGWTVQFDVQGTNGPADIFTTTNLFDRNSTNSHWTWLERGPSCSTYQYTNQPASQSYYILGTMRDSDYDGLPDAYEKLVSHTDPFGWTNLDADGDGMRDGWELQYFGNLNQTADGDTDGDGVNNFIEYLQGRNPIAGTAPDSGNQTQLTIFTPLK